MEQLNNLDVVFLVIVGVSALVAIIRGATKELLSVTGWVLAAVSVYYLMPIVNPITKKYISSEVLANLVSGMGILVVFCIFWVLTADKISAQIRSSKLSALDRIFGLVFGILRGIIIVILLQIMIVTLIPEESEKGVFAESKYFKLAGESSGPIKALIPEKWFDDIKAKSESLGLSGSDAKDDAVLKDAGEAAEEKLDDLKDAGSDKMELLKKSGEELFEELVQPKTDAEAADKKEGYNESETSDLERLMDVLEDKVVSTEEVPLPKLLSDEEAKEVILEEGVAK